MSSETPSITTLREEIAAARRHLVAVPFGACTQGEILEKAKRIKALAEKEEQLELSLESERMAAAVREFEELHPPANVDCPICLETIKYINSYSVVRFGCCGGWACKNCSNTRANQGTDTDVMMKNKCPLCRTKFPSKNEVWPILKRHARDGRAWAQYRMGRLLWYGVQGVPANKVEGLKMIKLAAEQQYADALFGLALINEKGCEGLVEQSYSKFMTLLEGAADLGLPVAQNNLALEFSSCGSEDIQRKAVLYSTLAASQGNLAIAYDRLGSLFLEGVGGLVKSLYLAKHYSELGVNLVANNQEDSQVNANTMSMLGITLLHIQSNQYEGQLYIPGHSCVPKVLYWLRKSLQIDSSQTEPAKIIENLEEVGKKRCANCNKDKNCFPGPLKQCVRCRAVWYCGKECQTVHWKGGHKIDCIKKK